MPLAALGRPARLPGPAFFLMAAFNGLQTEEPDHQDCYNSKIINELEVWVSRTPLESKRIKFYCMKSATSFVTQKSFFAFPGFSIMILTDMVPKYKNATFSC